METVVKEAVRDAETNAGAALIAGAADAAERFRHVSTPREFTGGKPYRMAADGTPHSLEAFLAQPRSVRGDVELYDVVSFVAYVNRFRNPQTLIFADERNSLFTAVIDYHDVKEDGQGGVQMGPSWLRNRAFLKLVHTDQWDEWIGQDGSDHAMSQELFAQFLEDHIPDIAEPPGAKLVEIARNLEATTSGRFSSAIRANDGSINFNYVKDVQAGANTSDGKVAVPTEVKLMLKPYKSLPDRYPVTGKLRYRLNSGRLLLWFDLFGVDEAIEEAFGDLRKNVESTTPCPILNGPAPKVQAAE
jgi:uncharacterized protein YfdQ (DUF2303 family)